MVSGTDEKTICCLCCASGPLIVEAKTDKAAYCPGDIVTISATFQNNSSKKVKTYAKLKQRRTFMAKTRLRSTTNSYDLIPLEGSDGQLVELDEGGSSSWNGMRFKIPPWFPSLKCKVIEVINYIEVGLNIPMTFNTEVYLPVVIGTINNSVHQDQPATAMTDPLAPPLPQGIGRMSRLPVNTVQPSSNIGWHTPWNGIGKKQSKGILPSTTPIPSTNQNVNVVPPSFYTAILANEKAEIGDNEGGDENEK